MQPGDVPGCFFARAKLINGLIDLRPLRSNNVGPEWSAANAEVRSNSKFDEREPFQLNSSEISISPHHVD